MNMNSTTIEDPIRNPSSDLKYVGFWPRLGASLIDTLIWLAIAFPLLTLVYGVDYWISEEIIKGPFDFFVSWVFPAVAVICFWVKRQATPGKMAIHAKIVDAKTGLVPTTGQYIGRYFAQVLSLLPFGMGYIWIAFDSKNQGWHDKLAETVVVAPKVIKRKEVSFDDS